MRSISAEIEWIGVVMKAKELGGTILLIILIFIGFSVYRYFF